MPSDGTKNLIPMSQREEAERRALGTKGGKASGVARRAKANLRKAIETVLSAKVSSEKASEQLKALGFDDTHEVAVALAMIHKATKGDTRAFEAITRFLAASKDQHDLSEQRQRIKAAKLANERAKRLGELDADSIVQSQVVFMNEDDIAD